MILYEDYETFVILNSKINLICNQNDYYYCTVAELNDNYCYLGDKKSNVHTAIFAWEQFHKRSLTDEEFRQTLNKYNIGESI